MKRPVTLSTVELRHLALVFRAKAKTAKKVGDNHAAERYLALVEIYERRAERLTT